MKNYKLYCLIDPRDNAIRYIGITSQKYLCKRLIGHIHKAKEKNTDKDKWIRLLISEGIRPRIKLIKKDIPIENWEEEEIKAIAEHKALGYKLLNQSIGGKGSNGIIINPETIEKLKLGHLKRTYYAKHTKESKAKISLANLGKKRDAECKAKMSKAKLGKYKGANSYNAKGLIGTDKETGKEYQFPTSREAFEYLQSTGIKVSAKNITAAKNGKRKSAGGFTWRTINK